MFLYYILAALASLSAGLSLWQWIVARHFPLHQRNANSNFAPPVTILKPLRGRDPDTEQCLTSWFKQNYNGDIQILFGVASSSDPVCHTVQQIISKFPLVDARLVICNEVLGPNAKISTVTQLEKQVTHDVVVLSDADVWVPEDFLQNIVQGLRDENVGLVNCFYCFANPGNTAMQWEAVAINADFWSQVLQSQSLKPIDFALGAAMATTRKQLKAVGDFAGLVDFLADDYQIGNRIARDGKKIELCPIVVECWEPKKSWGDIWKHQLRWARTIRICQPAPFFCSIIANATFWPLLWLAISPRLSTIIFTLICLFIRIATAMDNARRFTQKNISVSFLWLVPLRDFLNVLIWAFSFLGNKVEWRGERYQILRGGKLQKIQ